jgi:hypothetical protein
MISPDYNWESVAIQHVKYKSLQIGTGKCCEFSAHAQVRGIERMHRLQSQRLYIELFTHTLNGRVLHQRVKCEFSPFVSLSTGILESN